MSLVCVPIEKKKIFVKIWLTYPWIRDSIYFGRSENKQRSKKVKAKKLLTRNNEYAIINQSPKVRQSKSKIKIKKFLTDKKRYDRISKLSEQTVKQHIDN